MTQSLDNVDIVKCVFYVPTYTSFKTTNELYNYLYFLNNQQIKFMLL
jgi:hypothetical protein